MSAEITNTESIEITNTTESSEITNTTESSEITNTESSVKKIGLQSSDGDIITVDQSVAALSEMLKNMMEDVSSASLVPIPNVTTDILNKVIDYCKRHAETKDNEDLKAFDAEFVKVDQDTLFDLLIAANYMDIKGLLDLTSQTIADMIKGKSPEEIREIFNIVNDYTPDEEAEVRKENAWAFE